MNRSAWPGLALVAGGACTLLVNAGLTPFLQADAPFAVMAASNVFVWRQSFSAFAAILLLAGSVGLYESQSGRSGRFGAFAFGFAFFGSAVLLAHEWNQVFFVHELAGRAPEALESLEAAEGPSLFDLSAIIALSAFTLGWLLFALSQLMAGVYPRRGPILVLAGFISIPLLGAVLPNLWGMVVGNIVLASGWMLLGRQLLGEERRSSR
jgi:hypothetical protein